MPDTFIETPRFPDSVSYGSRGGPKYNTQVQTYYSGAEKRNAGWEFPRYSYNAAMGVKTMEDLDEVLEFFHVAMGRAYGFRYKDWLDHKSCGSNQTPLFSDQIIGTGTGSQTTFQLIKAYVVGPLQKTRRISKPVAGSVLVGVDGVQLLSGWTVDTATGIVTLDVAPALGVPVTAGFEFDVPVRFENDDLSIEIAQYDSGNASIDLLELRLP